MASQNLVQELSQPAGVPGQVYQLAALSGEIIFIPCSNSATRLLVTGKETNNAFAVVGSGGTASAPIGFHFHRETHDVFLCLKGQVNVWCGDKARTMNPGDFASVPPVCSSLDNSFAIARDMKLTGIEYHPSVPICWGLYRVHRFDCSWRVIQLHCCFKGAQAYAICSRWEEFFRFIGEPYAGPLFPLSDSRNPFEVLIPKLKAAAEQFDMVPVPHQKSFDPQPWDGTENKLPNGLEPYYLRAGAGPKYRLGATLCRPLITTAQSGGKFTIASIEGSSYHKTPIFSEGKSLVFPDAHHCFQVAQGKISFTVAGKTAVLSEFETLFIPAGTEFSFNYSSRLAKAYVFANGGGLVEVFLKLGKDYAPALMPETEEALDISSLPDLERELSFRLV